MCNDYRLMVELASVIEEFEHLKINIRFPEGRPNIEARRYQDHRYCAYCPGCRRRVRRRRTCPAAVELAKPE